MIKLKAGEKAWSYSFDFFTNKFMLEEKIIKGFRPGLALIEYVDGSFHRFSGMSFYGAGWDYSSRGVKKIFIVAKRRYLIPPALLVEVIRPRLPRKLARFLKLEF